MQKRELEYKDIEKALQDFSQTISINQELKSDLRNRFKPQYKKLNLKYLLSIAASIGLIVTVLALFQFDQARHVCAASLVVENYYNVINLQKQMNTGVSEHAQVVYIPCFEEGVYAYSDDGLQKVFENGEIIDYVSISSDGKELLFTEEGDINVYNLSSGQITEIKSHRSTSGDNQIINYQKPSWLPGDRAILYTQIIEEKNINTGLTEVKEAIYKYEIQTGETRKIAEGKNASFVKGQETVVYEREDKLYSMSLKNNIEQLIGEGNDPNISSDGLYLVFTKVDLTTKTLKENIFVEEGLQNIWIANTDDFSIRKQVTTNIPLRDIDSKEWLSSLTDQDSPQTLSYSGQYWYANPTWSSDGKSLYAIRKTFPSNDQIRGSIQSELIRIDLSTQESTLSELVKRNIRAQAAKNVDILSGQMVGPGADENDDANQYEITGYKLFDSNDKTDYLDTEISYAQKEEVGILIQKVRYYKQEGQKQQANLPAEVLEHIELSVKEDGIFRTNKGRAIDKPILLTEEIPYRSNQDVNKITSLAYSPSRDTVYFTLETVSNKKDFKIANLISYNEKSGEYKLLDSILGPDGAQLKVAKLCLDNSNSYLALESIVEKENTIKNEITLYDLNANTRVFLSKSYEGSQITSLSINFWDEDQLNIKGSSASQFAANFIFTPQAKDFNRY